LTVPRACATFLLSLPPVWCIRLSLGPPAMVLGGPFYWSR
jgi:hypothetical protein